MSDPLIAQGRRHARRYVLARYRWVLPVAVFGSYVLALCLQAILGTQIRLLFGFWIVLALVLGIAHVLVGRLADKRRWAADSRDAEYLAYLVQADSEGIQNPETRAWLAQFVPQIRNNWQIPYPVQLVAAIAFSLSLQVPSWGLYVDWLVRGPLGPEVTRRQVLVEQVQWQWIPPEYIGVAPRDLILGQSRSEIEQGGTLVARVQSTYDDVIVGDPDRKMYMAPTSDGSMALPLTTTGALNLRAELRRTGLVIRDPMVARIDIVPDAKPGAEWIAIDENHVLDEDQMWQSRYLMRDNHGLARAGIRIEDEHGQAVTDWLADVPGSSVLVTAVTVRFSPQMYLDKLQTGIWYVYPMGQDHNPFDTSVGYGQGITLEVSSRYDRHQQVLEQMDNLFDRSVDMLGQRFEDEPVDRGIAKEIRALQRSLQQTGENAWSAFGFETMAHGTSVLLDAIDHKQQPPMRFEEAALVLFQARAQEQEAEVSERLGAVERNQQDLMAALDDPSITDEEILRMLQELMKSMQAMQQAAKDRERPMPQEYLNRDAFKKENLRQQQSDVKSLVEQLRSGDREAALETLKSLMSQVDKMRAQMEKNGQQSSGAQSSSSGGESSDSMGGGSVSESLDRIQQAKESLQDAMEQQQEAMGKAGEAEQESRSNPGENRSGQSEEKDAREAGEEAGESMQEGFDKLGSKPGEEFSPFGTEQQQVQDAMDDWQKAMDQVGAGAKGMRDERMQQFQEHGEKSMQGLNKAMRSLQQKENALKRMQSQSGGGQNRPKQERFDERTQQAESAAKTRKKVFEYFKQGLPEQQRKANQNYFDRLVQ